MWSTFLRRLILAVPTLWAIITICFFLMRLTPGGPFDSDAPVPEEILANLRARYHLDEPLWQQYLFYLQGLVQGHQAGGQVAIIVGNKDFHSLERDE